MILPSVLSAALMTPVGRRFLVRKLGKTRGDLSTQVAGAMGGFFRAIMPLVLADPSDSAREQTPFEIQQFFPERAPNPDPGQN